MVPERQETSGNLPENKNLEEKAPVEIKRFSKEQREALEKQGFVIYELTGQSIKTFRDAGRKFHLRPLHTDYPFEVLGSIQSEVAINPDKPFLPISGYKIQDMQEKMVDEFSEELGKKIKGVKAIIGQHSDYTELAFKHFDATNHCLYDEYATTSTRATNSVVACVNGISAAGLDVYYRDVDEGYFIIHAAPLVVPV
jgi:hypothetical protein